MEKLTLPQLLEFLTARTAEDFKSEVVDRFLTRYRIDQDDFLPFIYFREETYGRNLIYKTDLFELVLVTWLPQQRTPIHDHSGQRCWMVVKSGMLSFKTYRPLTAGHENELVSAGPVEVHRAGDAVYIDDGVGVHSIANATSKPAISVHLYAGPISRCRIYNEKCRRFEWVDLEYFTMPDMMDTVTEPELITE